RRAGDELLAVDVPTLRARRRRRVHAVSDRRHAEHAEKWTEHDGLPRRRAAGGTVELPRDPVRPLGERLAPRAGDDRVDAHGERPALACAAHLDRPRERMAVVLRRAARLEPGAVVEQPAGVRRRDADRVAGVDRQDGRQVAREVPVQRAALERQLVDHSSERTAAATRSADGTYASSSVQYGYGTS